MKIHCAQLVEGALRSALAPESAAAAKPAESPAPPAAATLLEQFQAPGSGEKKLKIVMDAGLVNGRAPV